MRYLNDLFAYVAIMFFYILTTIYGVDNMKRLSKIIERY